MGLRTASLRRPHVAVMAPALTETAAQSQNFSLPPENHVEPASPINNFKTSKYLQKEPYCLDLSCHDSKHKYNKTCGEDIENFSHGCLNKQCADLENNSMKECPLPMGDQQDNKMGLQKANLSLSNFNKISKSGVSDVDQLFNLGSDGVCASNELGQNVEDIMQQVIKSMESSKNDISEEVFSTSGTDLINNFSENFSNFEKQLLEDVDVMNMTIEDEQETEQQIKEISAKDMHVNLKDKHARCERRLDFLRRRVYKIKSKLMGQHVSGEIAGVFEQVQRSLKRPKDSHDMSKSLDGSFSLSEPADKPKPISYNATKTLVRKLEMSAILQSNSASRQRQVSKYFGSGSVEMAPVRNSGVTGMMNIPPWSLENKFELQKVAGQLQTELGLVQQDVDSEATESSSGDESCDEMQTYNNPHQQYLSIDKRALWKYSTARAGVASHWTWLQSQISDIEYRIRQHADLQRRVREAKGGVQLGSPPRPTNAGTTESTTNDSTSESPTKDATLTSSNSTTCSTGPVNGYKGVLPGSNEATKSSEGEVKPADTANPTVSDEESQQMVCARVRPLVNFRKRKLLQISGLHAVSKKAARPSTMRCTCASSCVLAPCALCTGRTDPTHPRPPCDTLGKAEKIALLDPAYHPVFSMNEDISQSMHLEAIMKTTDWQQRSVRMKSVKVLSKSDRLEHKSQEQRKKYEHRKKYERLKSRTVSAALSEKIRHKIRGRKPKHLKFKKQHSDKSQHSHSATQSADEEVESLNIDSNTSTSRQNDTPSSSPLLQIQSISGLGRTRTRTVSYDIDNIVIPYSVAASTRVEKLQYKEILTPKWRIADPDFGAKNEHASDDASVDEPTIDNDVEDISEESIIARHERCEQDEKKRFLQYLKLPFGYGGRNRANRRTDSVAESSGANTPDRASPHPTDGTNNSNLQDASLGSPPATPQSSNEPEAPLPSIAVLMRRRTMSQCLRQREDSIGGFTENVPEVPPYERRNFPLSEEAYEEMMKVMPENHQITTNSRSQDYPTSPSSNHPPYDGDELFPSTQYGSGHHPGSPDTESTESAIGEEADEEDPNDPEWRSEADGHQHPRGHHHKSGGR